MLNGTGPRAVGMLWIWVWVWNGNAFPFPITNLPITIPGIACAPDNVNQRTFFIFVYSLTLGRSPCCGLLFAFKFPACWPFYLFKERALETLRLRGAKSRHRALRLEIDFQINTTSARWNWAAGFWPGQRAINWPGCIWFGLDQSGAINHNCQTICLGHGNWLGPIDCR